MVDRKKVSREIEKIIKAKPSRAIVKADDGNLRYGFMNEVVGGDEIVDFQRST